MDKVEDQNLDRSPVFLYGHVGHDKAEVVTQYLRDAGVADVIADVYPLDESVLWRSRQQGTPDLIISAANERYVRPIIEDGFPPLQIYGTTGENWQASVLRHLPLRDPCSCCVFPEMEHPMTVCATGEAVKPSGEKKPDAALPFLSFSAGLMAASEILKLTLKNFRPGANRVTFYPKENPRFVSAETVRRPGCLCGLRSASVHRQMIQGGRYSYLSGIDADGTSGKAEAE